MEICSCILQRQRREEEIEKFHSTDLLCKLLIHVLTLKEIEAQSIHQGNSISKVYVFKSVGILFFFKFVEFLQTIHISWGAVIRFLVGNSCGRRFL